MQTTELHPDSTARRPRRPAAALLAEHALLTLEEGMMRVPFLIKGRLVVPPRVARAEIDRTFALLDGALGPSDPESSYAAVGGAQVLRAPVIDRQRLSPTGAVVYTILPPFQAEAVIERDLDALVELYDLPFAEVLEWTAAVQRALDPELLFSVQAATLPIAEQPDAWHAAAFAAIPTLLDPATLRRTVDDELGAFGLPGTALLDAFCPLPVEAVELAPVNRFADLVFEGTGHRFQQRRPELRALPTRQLHITAGNSPHIPFLSALRAIASKSAAVIKSPSGAVLPGALLAVAAAAVAPDHPITRHLSVAYWRGGDPAVEGPFFAPSSAAGAIQAFDRVVVWGAPGAVESVRARALGTRVISFDPRYGASLVGREAYADPETLAHVARRVVCDALVANQKACIATQVLYAEGSEEQVHALASALQAALQSFDREAPNLVTPAQRGDVKRLMKGVFLDADWHVNEREGGFSSAVIVARQEFKLSALPMCRFLVVRPVQALEEALPYFHPGVATVSVYPEPRRRALLTRLGARGVSNIVPLGHSGTGFAGQAHDGMRVLSQLVDWKVG